MDIATDIALHTWAFLVESAPYLLFGFGAAGVLHGFISEDFVARHLGRGRFGPVFKSSLFGVPLPLCSCGVLPAAMGLRKKGATKGATISFLVSTPETGVDSIAITYALMGPVMTVVRPVAALVTAIFAGLLETVMGDDSRPDKEEKPACGCCAPAPLESLPFNKKITEGVKFAFDDLLRDLTPWLALGIVVAGLISALVPPGWFESVIGGGFTAMLAMLAVGVPMYICATATTPVAAALVLKGLSPGAALVLLLVGPATNAASLVTLSKQLGLGAVVRYLIAICATALAMGFATDYLYGMLGQAAASSVHLDAVTESHTFGTVSAVVLILLALWSVRPRSLRKGGCGCGDSCGDSADGHHHKESGCC